MKQLSAIAKYAEETRLNFNPILTQFTEMDMVNEIEKIVRACDRSVVFQIKYSGYRLIDRPEDVHDYLKDYEDRSLSKSSRTRSNNNSDYTHIPLKDSIVFVMVVTYKIGFAGEYRMIDVPIVLPKVIDKLYFRIMGNYYYHMFQIVDGSTYNNSNTSSKKHSVTFKTTFMAIRVYRSTDVKLKVANLGGSMKNLVLYTTNIFSKQINGMKYILAKYGLVSALEFMGLTQSVIVTQEIYDEDQYYIFPKNDFFVVSPKMLFHEDAVTQSMIYTIVASIDKDSKFNDLFKYTYWLAALGFDVSTQWSVDKGMEVCESLEGTYDQTSKETVMLPDYCKASIYHILRWLFTEFSNLKVKDNLDLSFKRLRKEYIVSPYAFKLSLGLHRLSKMGRKVDIGTIEKVLKINPMFLMGQITKIKLISYRNLVNDMDAFTLLKYTFKGPSGIADGNNSSVPLVFRLVHESHLGKIDLDSSNANDPGLSGSLVPFLDIKKHGYFEDFEEPHNWEHEFGTIVKTYMDMKGMKEAFTIRKALLDTENDTEYLDFINESLKSVEQFLQPAYTVANDIDTVHIQPFVIFQDTRKNKKGGVVISSTVSDDIDPEQDLPLDDDEIIIDDETLIDDSEE